MELTPEEKLRRLEALDHAVKNATGRMLSASDLLNMLAIIRAHGFILVPERETNGADT
jgi:hypothetical protein